MNVKDSQIIKGIAILLMYFQHLYSTTSRYEEFGLTGLIGSDTVMEIIAVACNVCVCLFVFVTAYGIAVQEKDNVYNREYYIKNSIRRYGDLLKHFASIFLILLFISYVFNLKYSASAAWGESQISRMLGILCNATGTAGIFQISWFSASWRYLSLAILLIFIVPVLHIVIKKIGSCPSIVISLFFVHSFGFDVAADGLPKYLFIVVLGIVFAEHNVFERIESYMEAKKGLRYFLVVILIAAIPLTAVIKSNVNSKYLLDAVMAILVIELTHLFIRRIACLNTVLAFIGKYCLDMWLIHSFFIEYWFQKFTYSFKNIWVIFFVLAAITLFISVSISKIEQLCSRPFVWKTSYKNYVLVLISLLTTAICFITAMVSSPLSYMTNDDGGIQSLLSGNVTGEPYITHQFINIILGAFISQLYKLFPQFQWWYVYSLVLIAAGIFMLHFCILKICKDKKVSIKSAILVMTVVDLSFMVYSIANVSFTTVPAILGTGTVALLFATDKIKNKKTLKWIGCIVVIEYILLLLHRSASAYALMCYILLGILWNLTNRHDINKKLILRFCLVCIFFVVLTGCITGLNKMASQKINGTEFIEFNAARAKYTDYGHDSYTENPELYEENGWSEEIYNLVGNWCFMDEAVTTEKLKFLSENSNVKCSVIASSKSTLKAVLKDTGCQALISLWIVSALFTVLSIAICFNNRQFCFVCMNNLGSVILLFYQLLKGRMLYRSLFVVLLPAVVINCILSLNNNLINKKENKIFKVILFIGILGCSSFVLDYTFDTVRNTYKEETMEKAKRIEEYVIKNPNNTYIYAPSVYTNISPWSVYGTKRLSNMIPWGGSAYNSDNYNKRLERNGIETLSGEVTKRKNVYLLFDENLLEEQLADEDILPTSFYKYLQRKFNAKGFVIEDDIDQKVYVYRFVFDDNKEDFETYYTIDHGKIMEIENKE